MQNFITPFLSSSRPPPYFHVPRPTSGILRPLRPNSRSFIYATPALPGWFVRKADAQLLPLGEGAVRVARFCASRALARMSIKKLTRQPTVHLTKDDSVRQHVSWCACGKCPRLVFVRSA